MICTACNTENPDQAKFCMGCGDALQNLCPECGTELPANAKFCFSCGTKVGDADPSPAPVTAESETAPSVNPAEVAAVEAEALS